MSAEGSWIPVTSEADFADHPRWAIGGTAVFYLSRRDGNYCVWRRHFNPNAAEAAGEMAVFPWMIKMEASVIPSLIMADPFAIVMDMRGFGMALAIAVVGLGSTLVRRFMGSAVVRLRPVVGNVSATNGVTAAAVTAMLRPQGQREYERDSNDFKSRSHAKEPPQA